ncbi:hypothetical protein SEVIR_6G169500v4 [Setaria viridis]|uniref:C2H2-type domain-containing protein n=2 Tax=Setaria viridis TaxID=4556 RepID=A0A4U6U9H6_SETVI|nr:uncharacterized protein LOC117862128 [Setaria viridis]TKW10513.1 hypothetical protein SEVIR_6G169500v2 [Setaria viridis]
MEIARRAAATDCLDDAYLLPDHSPSHGRMSVDALRREFVKESILQEIILAELAERRELEPEVRRELGLEHAGPLSLGTRPGLQLTASSHHDTSPVRQGAQLHLHMPVLPEPCLVEGVMTPGGVLVPRVSVKDRIDEWYRTPWNKGFADEDMLIDWARLPKKTFSGVKRKRTAETSTSNKKRSSEKWICSLCHVNTYSEVSFEEHCAGYRHQSNLAEFEWTKEAAGAKRISTAEASIGMQHNPTAWNCSICQVKCSGELDLNNHLKGRRHQENAEVLWGESKESEGKSGFKEVELYEKKEVQLVNMDQRPTSRWNCSICKANCTSESDLESHLRGRRHEQTVKAQSIQGTRRPARQSASHLGGKNLQAVLSAYNWDAVANIVAKDDVAI